jgi:hypothetical protein
MSEQKRGRVFVEPPDIGDAVARHMAEQAWPGVFMTGKKVMRVADNVMPETGMRQIIMTFDDNSSVKLIVSQVDCRPPNDELLDGQLLLEEDL